MVVVAGMIHATGYDTCRHTAARCSTERVPSNPRGPWPVSGTVLSGNPKLSTRSMSSNILCAVTAEIGGPSPIVDCEGFWSPIITTSDSELHCTGR